MYPLVHSVLLRVLSPSLLIPLDGLSLVQAAWVAGQYAHINFSDANNFRKALHSVVSGLRDPELPVRVDSVFALRSFVEACRGKLSFFNYMVQCSFFLVILACARAPTHTHLFF